eukprot:COSAG02_NODE_25255_length_664_cov_0.911504_1_plen_71_part_10
MNAPVPDQCEAVSTCMEHAAEEAPYERRQLLQRYGDARARWGTGGLRGVGDAGGEHHALGDVPIAARAGAA